LYLDLIESTRHIAPNTADNMYTVKLIEPCCFIVASMFRESVNAQSSANGFTGD